VWVDRGKFLLPIQRFTKNINELTSEESDSVLDYLTRHISENHDLQVRYRWQPNDIAIWDNRVTVHTATYAFTLVPPRFRFYVFFLIATTTPIIVRVIAWSAWARSLTLTRIRNLVEKHLVSTQTDLLVPWPQYHCFRSLFLFGP